MARKDFQSRGRTGHPTRAGCLSLLALSILSCSTPKPIPGVVKAPLGETMKSIPGPMPDFGPFDDYSDALLAACPLILSKPHAYAGRPGDPQFDMYFRLATEYCAWIYHTPDGKFEMSLLTTDPVQADPSTRTCTLPADVNDARYPPNSLDYVFAIHSHPYMEQTGNDDIDFIVRMGRRHGFSVKDGNRKVPISAVAFFSSSADIDHPTCDGFFLYSPTEGEIYKWTPTNGIWAQKPVARLKWHSPDKFTIERQ